MLEEFSLHYCVANFIIIPACTYLPFCYSLKSLWYSYFAISFLKIIEGEILLVSKTVNHNYFVV